MTEDEFLEREELPRYWTWPGLGVHVLVAVKGFLDVMAEFLEEVAEDLAGIANRQVDAQHNFHEASRELEQMSKES
jgi:F0F1-type ATP synthase membrane subunit b/b'